MIIKDAKGSELLEIIDVEEALAESFFSPVTHSLAVVKIGNEYLMGWNHFRKNWEIFGGCKDDGETIRECIIRECKEELGLTDVEYTYIGLMKLNLAPGYFNLEWHEEYGALYGVTLPKEIIKTIETQRKDKNEIEKLSFYCDINSDEKIAIIDEKLIEYWKG